MLNIRDALELYTLLKPGLPEEVPETMLEFTGKIVSGLKNSEYPENFGKAIILLTGHSIEILDELNSQERINLFVEGLLDNHFLDLVDFCEVLGL